MYDYSEFNLYQLEQYAEDLWEQVERDKDPDKRQLYEDVMDELARRRNEKTEESH